MIFLVSVNHANAVRILLRIPIFVLHLKGVMKKTKSMVSIIIPIISRADADEIIRVKDRRTKQDSTG